MTDRYLQASVTARLAGELLVRVLDSGGGAEAALRAPAEQAFILEALIPRQPGGSSR